MTDQIIFVLQTCSKAKETKELEKDLQKKREREKNHPKQETVVNILRVILSLVL